MKLPSAFTASYPYTPLAASYVLVTLPPPALAVVVVLNTSALVSGSYRVSELSPPLSDELTSTGVNTLMPALLCA